MTLTPPRDSSRRPPKTPVACAHDEDARDAADLVQVIEDLLRAWDRDHGQLRVGVDLTLADGAPNVEGDFVLAWAFAGQAHSAARGLLAARSAVGDLASVPLARAALEFGVTAYWIASEPGRGTEFAHGDRVHLDGLAKAFADSPDPRWQEMAVLVRQRVEDVPDASLGKKTVSPRQITREISGTEAYAQYRLLSQLAHPSVMLAEQWFAPPTTSGGPPQARTWADRTPDPWALHVSAVGLLLAQEGVDKLLETQLFEASTDWAHKRVQELQERLAGRPTPAKPPTA